METKPTDCVLTKQRGDSAPCDITKGCYHMPPPPPLHFHQHDHGEAYIGELLIDHSFESRGASMFFFDSLRFACLIFFHSSHCGFPSTPPPTRPPIAVATPGSFSASSCEGRTVSSCWWSPRRWRLTKPGGLTAEGFQRPIRALPPRPQGNQESSCTANHADAPFANVCPTTDPPLFFSRGALFTQPLLDLILVRFAEQRRRQKPRTTILYSQHRLIGKKS